MVLDIRIYGDTVLKKRCRPVVRIDEEIQRLAADMAETMYLCKGVGLAASQVGVAKRVIVIDVSEEHNSLLTLVNPEVIHEEGEEMAKEGCLSLPGISAEVSRPRKIGVKGLSLEGEKIEIMGEGLVSRALSHEIDHLDGILFIDRLSKEKKRELARELKELKRLVRKGISRD